MQSEKQINRQKHQTKDPKCLIKKVPHLLV